MIVFVIGSGAREHALCRLINKSEFCEKLTCIPGNYGISKIAKCINLDNSEDILAYCFQNKPDLVKGPHEGYDREEADDGRIQVEVQKGRRRRLIMSVSKLDVAGEGREARRPARLRRCFREERG